MELLASRDDKQVWFQELSRPFRMGSPFSGEPFVCILFANDRVITADEQATISEQLVRFGCRYAVCAGHESSSWDDSIDLAYLVDSNYAPEDDTFVMTTWHDDESVKEVIFFGLMNTNFDSHDFRRFLVLSVGHSSDLCRAVREAIQKVW